MIEASPLHLLESMVFNNLEGPKTLGHPANNFSPESRLSFSMHRTWKISSVSWYAPGFCFCRHAMGVGNSNSPLSRVSSHPSPGSRSQPHQGLRDLFSRVCGIVTLFCRIPGLFAPTGLDVQDKVSGRGLIRVIKEAPGFVIALPCGTVELMTSPTANIRNSWDSFIERVYWGFPVTH
jgi:hypothetical protein